MRVEKDFEELLKLFNKHNVKYCIVGAFAFAFYGKPRYTKDLDILIEPTVENSKKVKQALEVFGFQSLNLKESDFSQKGKFIQLGYEPMRVDLITSLEGLKFDQVWKHKSEGHYGQQQVFFIGLDELIKAKKIAGRMQDLADLEILISVKKRKK